MYPLRLFAKYTGQEYANEAVLDFAVTMTDPCAAAEFTIDPAIVTTAVPSLSIIYTVGEPAVEITFSDSYISTDFI